MSETSGSFVLNASVESESTNTVVTAYAMEAATEAARALPSPRHGSQAYFWTAEWQQKEHLADYDFLIGNVFRPVDAQDLIRHLHEEAARADAG